jgi:hypothetical protein
MDSSVGDGRVRQGTVIANMRVDSSYDVMAETMKSIVRQTTQTYDLAACPYFTFV